MRAALSRLAATALRPFDREIVSSEELRGLRDLRSDVSSLLELPTKKLAALTELRERAKSQLQQDLFVLSELDFKERGYFVEFGATNGVDLSNTWILEKDFGWRGILAEPARCWHDELAINRVAHVETRCVWRDSTSTLQFNETRDAVLSTVQEFSASDYHQKNREGGRLYDVSTLSLIDMLDKYGAPHHVDYLSIDTEGSEYEILSHFDFDKYEFGIITCEHNYTPARKQIFDLLTGKGYRRKYLGLSQWDDWYVKAP